MMMITCPDNIWQNVILAVQHCDVAPSLG